jgi:hypothetical protein
MSLCHFHNDLGRETFYDGTEIQCFKNATLKKMQQKIA